MALWHGVAAPAANVSGILKQVPGGAGHGHPGRRCEVARNFPKTTTLNMPTINQWLKIIAATIARS